MKDNFSTKFNFHTQDPGLSSWPEPPFLETSNQKSGKLVDWEGQYIWGHKYQFVATFIWETKWDSEAQTIFTLVQSYGVEEN